MGAKPNDAAMAVRLTLIVIMLHLKARLRHFQEAPI